MAVSQQAKNQHLLWRAGFGVNAETVKNISAVSHHAFYKVLETASLSQPAYIDVADDTVKGLVLGFQQIADMQQMEKPGTKMDPTLAQYFGLTDHEEVITYFSCALYRKFMIQGGH